MWCDSHALWISVVVVRAGYVGWLDQFRPDPCILARILSGVAKLFDDFDYTDGVLVSGDWVRRGEGKYEDWVEFSKTKVWNSKMRGKGVGSRVLFALFFLWKKVIKMALFHFFSIFLKTMHDSIRVTLTLCLTAKPTDSHWVYDVSNSTVKLGSVITPIPNRSESSLITLLLLLQKIILKKKEKYIWHIKQKRKR